MASNRISDRVLGKLSEALPDENVQILFITVLSSTPDIKKINLLLEAALDCDIEIFTTNVRTILQQNYDNIEKAAEKIHNTYDLILSPNKNGAHTVSESGENSILLNNIRNIGAVLLATDPQQMSEWLFLIENLCSRIAPNVPSLTIFLQGTVQKFLASPRVIGVTLAVVFLGIDAIMSIRAWYRNEISGTECAHQIIVSISTLGGAIVGAFIGGAIGAVMGPVLSVVGTSIGAYIGAEAAKRLLDWLVRFLFGPPTKIGIQEAYKFLHCEPSDFNRAINEKFRELCNVYRDDGVEFSKLQACMAVIKIHREKQPA